MGESATSGSAPTLANRIEYAFVRLLAVAVLCTDVRGAARIGRVLGRLLGKIDRRHRELAEDNLRRAYGAALPEAEVKRIVDRVYENMLDILTVARPLDNPLVDGWVTSVRHAVGHFSVPKDGALRGLLRTVRSGKCIGMLADQNGGRHGRLSTFFGRPCSTQAGGIVLARRLGIPFTIGSLERRAPGFHRLVLGPPVYVRDGEDGEREAVDAMNRGIEEFVRRRPADWMWLHRRWRIKADWGFPVEPTEGKRKP
jgi:lauroyl/myristoyl acyltransferase